MGDKAHAGSRDNLLGNNPSKEVIEKYSSEKQVTGQTPATLIFHAGNDKIVDPSNSLMFYKALMEKNVPASLHIFPLGGHNIGLGINPGSTQLWTLLSEMWLKEMGFLP
jgi:dipeptidyl aminopeptidase/acylaminoacyl peptidase